MVEWVKFAVILLLSAAVVSGHPNPYGIRLGRERQLEPQTNEDEYATKVSYQGSQLWKVLVDNDRRREIILTLKSDQEISTWGGNTSSIDIVVGPDYVNHVSKVFQENEMPFEVMIPDLQRAIDTENPYSDEEATELANRKGHRMTWSSYHRLSDIDDYLNYLAQTYPSIVSIKTIGNSVQGKPIKLIKISNGKIGNKAVWIDGGIHAREWISPASVSYIINEFVENFEDETEDIKNTDWYIAPVLNPDGYEYTHMYDRLWRKNRSKFSRCSGTDLNRNFGYKWGGRGSSKNPCAETYGGTGPFSEPETVAVKSFISNSGVKFDAYISFHSYGQYILYPWGYNAVVPPDHADLQRVAQKAAQSQLKDTKRILDENEMIVNKKSYNMNQELESVIEELKDTKELNTALQLQLDNLTKTHQELKVSYDELFYSKRNLESRIVDLDTNYIKCKTELVTIRENNEKLLESEMNYKKLLEIEKLQSKTARLQNEKDAKCIQDLNRQVKEMERIIQRKHPDSVSALIVAAKNDTDTNNATRTLLESRIKQLESEASARETQSNKVFSEVQDKFNLMKAKYESHIEDLETHVNDLKNQLKTKSDTYDIYTQTYIDEVITTKLEDKKDTFSVSVQTDQLKPTKMTRKVEKPNYKDDAHLLATVRGLQADLNSKEKFVMKLQKEMDEMQKVNKKLQKEREITLRNGHDKDKTINERHIRTATPSDTNLHSSDKDIFILKDERDKLKTQLCRLEDDYQTLKTKRIQDLNILQEAHEREITTYMSNVAPMREQLDVQQLTINNLQGQLASAKEELAIITIERDHLDSKLKNIMVAESECPTTDNTQISLQKKITYLERRYEEREHRLRAIVHGLAQKQVTARDCAQCAARQQQLIGYKAELDQLLATLRYLQ